MLRVRESKSTSSQKFYTKLKEGGLYHVHSIFSSSFNIVKDNQFLNINFNLSTLTSLGLKISEENWIKIKKNLAINQIVKLDQTSITFYTSVQVIMLVLDRIEIFKSYPTKLNNKAFFEIMNIKGLKPDTLLEHVNLSHQALVGRGIGFTPSGDDFNWGYFMILQLLNVPLPSLDTSGTTEIVKNIYELLYVKQWGWIYVNLFESDDTKKYIDYLLNYGHSSGHDTLFGMKQALYEYSK